MNNNKNLQFSWTVFMLAFLLLVYMPLHVFIAQSASLLTGGLNAWKAAKDVLIFVVGPILLYLSYKRGLFKNKIFRYILSLGLLYGLIHGLFLLFDRNDDTYSALVGSVYNTRILLYLLLGFLVGSAKDGRRHLKFLLTAVVLIATAVAIFGIAQYFLPSDLLTHVGYSLERGVKPLFFIDDRPDLPRVMGTLKDPNSFGAYLILPTLLSAAALFKSKLNKELFVRPFKRVVLAMMLLVQFLALILTFSRGSLIGLFLSTLCLTAITNTQLLAYMWKKFWIVVVLLGFITMGGLFSLRNSAPVQDYILHAAKSTNLEDPNELRISLAQDALQDVLETPQGHGPGSAGLVSINNPKGGILTENYYLQIAYEVGWLGLTIFVGILVILTYQLFKVSHNNTAAAILLSALVGYLFYSLLVHLWSNEAVALQWWLLTGAVIGLNLVPKAYFTKS